MFFFEICMSRKGFLFKDELLRFSRDVIYTPLPQWLNFMCFFRVFFPLKMTKKPTSLNFSKQGN